jgi:hypothetical protein
MWPSNEHAKAFQALPYGTKLRVSWCLARGKSPGDPVLAAAAIEMAESYERQKRSNLRLERWSALFLIFWVGCAAIFHLIDGDTLSLIFYVSIFLLSTASLSINPAAWPRNRRKSLEQSRKMVAGTPSDS